RVASAPTSTAGRSKTDSARLCGPDEMGVELTSQDLLDLASGAAFLGTGGGGDPYVGRLMVEQSLAEGGKLTLISPDEVSGDAFVIPTAMMGAATVLVQKIPGGDQAGPSLTPP